MAKTMRKERYASSGFQDIFFRALQDTEGEEDFDGDLVSCEVDVVPEDAFFEHVGADMLHLEDNVIDSSAFRAKFAIDRERSRLLQISNIS